MITESWFVCEACGSRYRSRDLALACEATALPPCPVAPGDAVAVRVRYDAPEPDVVTSVRIAPSNIACVTGDLPDGHRMVVGLVSGTMASPLHEWRVTVAERHQLGKDADSYVDEVSLYDLFVDGRPLAEAA